MTGVGQKEQNFTTDGAKNQTQDLMPTRIAICSPLHIGDKVVNEGKC